MPDIEHADLEVQQERDLLLLVLATMHDEVWMIDLQGQVTFLNPAAQRAFGLKAELPIKIETVVGAVEIFNPDGTPRPLDQAPPLRLLRGEMIDYAEEIVRLPATGTLHYRQIRLSRVLDQTGKTMGVVSVVRDLTRFKQYDIDSLGLLHRIEGVITDLIPQTAAENQATRTTSLTARQREVLELLADGLTSIEIANRLFISPETVRSHRHNLMRKLGLRNKAELIRYAIEHDIETKKGRG
ncbi:LuxR C-terminal-related transcriptional regulator [Rhabdochromatium marinum]|uniref:LuxR C-terminal-related transcriptional regulator n=1 Tax=Rhabdochromatium marinum TaxID=48729 RepID=UPI0019047D80|nr:LuxR C-terminal-related transcriptional regulator [Rhabdochromatium marinum]MBK1649188.1 hypothetical protein [Rhabdochromatium marinum]